MEEKDKKILAIGLFAILLIGVGVGFFLKPSEIAEKEKTAEVPAALPEKSKVTLAIMPTERADEILPRAKELESFLESRVNADIEIYVPLSYSAVVEALRFNQAQVGFMSAWPAAVTARFKAGDVVLAEIREVIVDGKNVNETYYYSHYVVLKDSNYTTLEDLRGKRVAYTSLTSTSGYLFPVAKLVEKSLISKPAAGKEAEPKEFFGSVLIAGGYAQAWEALKRGQVDVAVIAGDVSEKLYREVIENTSIVETQGPIPSHAIVFSKNMEEPLRTELVSAFLELNKPEHQGLMRKLISAIFVGFKKTSSDEHLAGLAGTLNATGYRFTERL